MSACVDLPDKDYEMIDLAGVWARERHVRRHKLDYGIQSIYSMRGCSSYQFNPFLALARENADEFQGQVYGFSLVYSGNFLAQTEVDNYDTARVLMGIHPNGFKWTLGKGESLSLIHILFFICSDEYQLRVDHHYPDAYHAFLCGGTEEQDRPASACRTGKII